MLFRHLKSTLFIAISGSFIIFPSILNTFIDSKQTLHFLEASLENLFAVQALEPRSANDSHEISNVFSLLGEILNDDKRQSLAISQAKAGKFNQALQLSDYIENKSRKAVTLAEIAGQYLKVDQTEKADPLLAEVLKIVRELEEISARDLAEIAVQYSIAGQTEQANLLFSQALKKIQSLPEPSSTPNEEGQIAWNASKVFALNDVARAYGKAGQFDRAIKLAKTISETNNRSSTLADISRYLAEAGQLDEAFEVTQELENGTDKAELLAELSIRFAGEGQHKKAAETFAQILPAAKLADEGLVDGHDRVLVDIAIQYAKEEQYEQAEELVQAIGTTGESDDSAQYKAEALTGIARQAAVVGKTELASGILAQAYQIAQTIENSSHYQLEDIAIAYAAVRQYEKAIDVAEEIKPDENDDIFSHLPIRSRVVALVQIAVQAVMNNDFDKASEVLEIAQPLEIPHTYVADVLVELTIQYLAANKQEKATETFSWALQIALFQDSRQDTINPSSILVEMIGIEEKGELVGQGYDSKRSSLIEMTIRYIEAEQYPQALQVAQTLHQVNTISQLIQQGKQQYRKAQLEAAIQSWKKALQITKEIDDRQRIAEVSTYLAYAKKLGSDHAKLLAFLMEIDDSEIKRIVFTSLIAPYYQSKDYALGLEAAQQLLNIARQNNNHKLEIIAKGLLGIVYSNLGEHQRAVYYLQQYLPHASEVGGDLAKGTALNNLGIAYLALKEQDIALGYLEQSLSLAQKIKNSELEGKYIIDLAYAYLAQDNAEKALELLEPILWFTGGQIGALEAFDIRFRIEFLSVMGIAADMQGQSEDSIRYLNASRLTARKLNQQQAASLLLQAIMSPRLYSTNPALLNEEFIETSTNFGVALFKAGLFSNAENILQGSIDIGNELLHNLVDSDFTKIAFLEKQNQVYGLQQKILIAQNDNEKNAKALEISEAGRARAFVELLTKYVNNSFFTFKPSPPSVETIKEIAREQNATLVEYSLISSDDLQFQIPGKKKQVDLELLIWVVKPNGEIELRKKNLESVLGNTTLQTLIENTRASIFKEGFVGNNISLGETLNLPPTSLQQSSLTLDDLTIGDLVKLNDDIADNSAWIVVAIDSQSKQLILRQPSWEEGFTIDRPITDVVTKVESQRVSNQQLRQLHQLLIEPINNLLPKNDEERIIFIPQKELFLVPFAALQDTNGKYLVEKHPILTAPAIQVLQSTYQRRQQPSSAQEVLLVGNPTMPQIYSFPEKNPRQLRDLPEAEDEVREIASLFKTDFLTGEEATKAEILPRLSQAKIIHLATHGIFENIRGLDSAIALAPSGQDNGLLTAEEIFNLGEKAKGKLINAELVVLSACDTGQGRIRSDGVIGLSRSLMSAGASSLIVSLWNVPDAPTADLMAEFYRQWQNHPNQDKAQALRKAMIKTMQDNPEPKDWAAFTLIGEAF